MEKVEVLYNPYTQKAVLRVEGMEYAHRDSRLCEFVVGKPIEQWISYYAVSYRHWDGFLPELAEELNEDELDLVFCGVESDYHLFLDGISRTFDDVRLKGFEPANCNISWKLRYDPENMLPCLRRFAGQQLKMLTTQMNILRMETLCNRLEEADSMGISDIRDIMKKIGDLLQKAVTDSRTEKQRNYWVKAAGQFDYMCETGK